MSKHFSRSQYIKRYEVQSTKKKKIIKHKQTDHDKNEVHRDEELDR